MNNKNTRFTNQTAAQSVPFVLLQDDWVQLSPSGDFPHAKGLQRIDSTATHALVENFHSFSGKLGRRFAGVPFYIGHPDVPGLENTFPDRKAYGWIMDLESRPEGLYGQIKWSKTGHDLIENAHYKFLSPYWEATEAGFENGRKVFRPQVLISVGLTNQPNIPVLPLANTVPEADSLSLQNSTASSGAGSENPATHSIDPLLALQNTVESLSTALRDEKQSRLRDNARFQDIESRLALVNLRFLNSLLDAALIQGKILPTEREHWLKQLDTDFESKSTELANAKPILQTSFTRKFPNTSAPEPGPATHKKIQRMIEQKMKTSQLTYHEAWLELKEEHPELFADMHNPVRLPHTDL